MNKQNLSTRLMMNVNKAAFAGALFTTETDLTRKKAYNQDNEDALPTLNDEHEIASHLKVSSFSNLVKATPFQTFSTNASSDQSNFTVSLSPIYEGSAADTWSDSVQNYLTSALSKTSGQETPILRSILKTPENSRFRKERRN